MPTRGKACGLRIRGAPNKAFAPLTRRWVQGNMAITKKKIFHWMVALAILGGFGFWYYISVTGIAEEIQKSL